MTPAHPVPIPEAPGRAAEDAAARFLRKQGYVLLARNFSTPQGEVDIIAADGETVVFVEVRSRASRGSVEPHASVGPAKQARVRAAASRYLATKKAEGALCRFDVVSLVRHREVRGGWEIELFRDAF